MTSLSSDYRPATSSAQYYTPTGYYPPPSSTGEPRSSYFAGISPPSFSSYSYKPYSYSSPPYSHVTSYNPNYSTAPSTTPSPTTDTRGVVWQYVASNNTWSLAPASSATPIESEVTAEKPSGAPLPAIVGAVIASVFVIVAIVIGRMWVRHRRAKAARQDARAMREIGRGDGGVWSFENQTAPAMVTREALASRDPPLRVREAIRDSASVWTDDSEMDMMATDGSTLARTLSTRSTSSDATIRTLAINTREALDHPGYTYRPAARTLTAGRSTTSPQTLRSPFSDSSSPDTTISPFADTSSTSLPRAPSRLSTTSSENPFRDPLPAYTVEEEGRAPPELLSNVPMMGEGGLERALQRPPPAYVERDRAAR